LKIPQKHTVTFITTSLTTSLISMFRPIPVVPFTAIGTRFSKPTNSPSRPAALPISKTSRSLPGGRSTRKSGVIFPHLLDRPEKGQIHLTGLQQKAQRVTMPTDPQHRSLVFQRTDGDFTVTLAEGVWYQRATVLKLETNASH